MKAPEIFIQAATDDFYKYSNPVQLIGIGFTKQRAKKELIRSIAPMRKINFRLDLPFGYGCNKEEAAGRKAQVDAIAKKILYSAAIRHFCKR